MNHEDKVITIVPQEQGVEIEILYTPQEMAARLNDMKAKLGLVQSFFKEVMVPEQDYGVIPGTDKPTLLKPGAEKLCELYGFAPVIKQVEEEKNIETGFYRARVTVALIHRRSGVTVAEGVGEANTMEGRYRWRWVPEWKVPKNLDKNTLHYEEKKDKNGQTYKAYRIPNEDPWALWNTVLKMAKKRALIDATLSATRSSGIFTQDAEDLEEWIEAGQAVEGYTQAQPQPPRVPKPSTAKNKEKLNSQSIQPDWTTFWKNVKTELKLKEKDVEELATEYLGTEVKITKLSTHIKTQQELDQLYEYLKTTTVRPIDRTEQMSIGV